MFLRDMAASFRSTALEAASSTTVARPGGCVSTIRSRASAEHVIDTIKTVKSACACQ